MSRRQVLAAAGGTGLLGAAVLGAGAPAARAAAVRADSAAAPGTPEQVHLTWGDDPATSVVVSWASAGPAVHPRVHLGSRIIPAHERVYTDGLNGITVWSYHARVTGLRPGTGYEYTVTADNAAGAFSASFLTAPQGPASFRFTSFGDLATPNTDWVLSYGQAACAVAAVERFQTREPCT